MLVLTRKPNEAIMIGSIIRIVVVGLDREQVKLGIDAPRDMPVHRYEIFEEIDRANKSKVRTVREGSTEVDTSVIPTATESD